MTKEEILLEMVAIYKKYFKVVETMGTLTMSPQDKQRLAELELKLPAAPNFEAR
jgi:septum formation topological specificity factor MinE